MQVLAMLFSLFFCAFVVGQQVPKVCCAGCGTVTLAYNDTVTLASSMCQQGEVAMVQGVTLNANGTLVARITSDPVNWYDNYHGGFGLRETASYALTCFNEPSLRGGVEQTVSVIAQCLTPSGCSVQHRQNFTCGKAPPLSRCTCPECHNLTTLRGTEDQEVVGYISCPKPSDEVVVVRMNAAVTKPNQVFNLLVQENPDSDNYFPAASAVSAACASISDLKLSGVNSAYVVAQCVTQDCNLQWNVSLKCESKTPASPSCACEDCTSTLRLEAGQSKVFTKECAKEVGVTALRFVTPNQGFRVSSNSSWLSSPATSLTTCFFSPKSTIWTGQRQLTTKLECLDPQGCDFTYKLSTVCECACNECTNPAVMLTRGEKRVWEPQVCGVGEVSTITTLRALSTDGVFTVSGVNKQNDSLISLLSSTGRTTCFDSYLEKPVKMQNSSLEVKCLSQQCTLRYNISFGCAPANSFMISLAGSPTQCLTLSGNALSVSPCTSSSLLQRFTFALANPLAVGASGKAFFLGKVVTLRPLSSPQTCISAQGRLLASCGPAAKLRATGQDNAFNLGGQGKTGGCLVAQNSNVAKNACPKSFVWAVYATISI